MPTLFLFYALRFVAWILVYKKEIHQCRENKSLQKMVEESRIIPLIVVTSSIIILAELLTRG